MSSIIRATTTSGLQVAPDNSGSLQLQTNGTTAAVTIDTSQNVGIGTASPSQRLQVDSTGATSTVFSRNGGTNANTNVQFKNSTTSFYLGTNTSGNFAIKYNDADLATSPNMVIDSSGNVLVGATSQFSGFVANAKLYTESSTADFITHFRNTNGTAANAFGLALSYSTAPNGTSNPFLDARDSSAQRAAIRSNGGLANFSANNVNLSDERLKTDITPAKSYLNTICSIPVVTFKYNDQTDEELNLGVIAQAVDTVAPELVDHSGFGETPEGESPYLAIYQTDLQYALMKCIQEQQAIINDLKARVETLEGAKLG